MISVSEAQDIICKNIKPLPPQRLALLAAGGKTLAEDIWSLIDLPPFIQSSMDGYAIRYSDKDLVLTIKGEMAAGTTQDLSIQPGEAARIFTGAPLPDGADTVVMQEKVSSQDDRLYINDAALKAGLHVRQKGADVQKGKLAVQRDTLLTPAAVGFLAGIGITEVIAYPSPSVTIIVTGKELQTPGKPLRHGQVYESNSFSLRVALAQAAVHDVTVVQADDDITELATLLQNALAASDLIILTGGVSVGDYDFVIEATKRCGVQQHFHKVAQRPGKPLYFGMKERKPVFGLPGNPSSVLSCFYNYVLLALGGLMNKHLHLQVVQASLTKDLVTPNGLTQFLKGWYEAGLAMPLGAQESFQLSSFAQANCLIRLAAEREEYTKGESVDVLLLPQ